MKALLRNVYLYIFGIPAVIFMGLMALHIESDPINLVARIMVSALVTYIAGRYIWRAASLVRENDKRPEAFNVVGWATFLVAFILSTLYGALFILLGRPPWLTSLYFNASFIVLSAVGAAMVAWSIPRVGMFPSEQKGVAGAAAFIIGASIMFVVSHLPQVGYVIRNLFTSLAHAL